MRHFFIFFVPSPGRRRCILEKQSSRSRWTQCATICQSSRNQPRHFTRICGVKCILRACPAGTYAALKSLLYVVARKWNHLFLRSSEHVIVLYVLRGRRLHCVAGEEFLFNYFIRLLQCCLSLACMVWSAVFGTARRLNICFYILLRTI